MKKVAILAIALALTGCKHYGDKKISNTPSQSVSVAPTNVKPLTIKRVISKIDKKMIWLSNGRKYEIAPFLPNRFGHWEAESEIEISTSEHNRYPLQLRNTATDETVLARPG